MDNKKPLLEMINVSKSFPGVKALQNVNLKAYGGEVMALLGENGAGKSTLMKILSGVYKKDEGQILIDGKEVTVKGIKDAAELGISIIHQELSLLPNLTVWENIFLGCEKRSSLTRRLDKSHMIGESKKLLAEIGLSIDPTTTTGRLSVGEMQMIEIIKAVSKRARIIIMDEPTTALTDKETDKLFEVIDKLKTQNIGVIYISHRMEEIFKICSRVTVLRDGKYIGEEKIEDVTRDRLISMMVGRNLKDQYPYLEPQEGKVLLEVKNLSMKNRIHDVSFKVKEGEILGIAGLMGSGRSEVAKLIFGEHKMQSGEIFIEGKKVNINSPKDAIENGIAYLSEDRKKEGIVLNLSVGVNMTLSNLKNYEKGLKKLSRKKEEEDVKHFIKKLSIKTTGYNQIIGNLSGGNQQKVIIAKWIMLSPKVLIIDEPTKGIDVGAKREIYEVLNELKAQGKAIIMISSELPEVLGISDRIIVMSDGKISGELERGEANQENIMKYAIGINQ